MQSQSPYMVYQTNLKYLCPTAEVLQCFWFNYRVQHLKTEQAYLRLIKKTFIQCDLLRMKHKTVVSYLPAG